MVNGQGRSKGIRLLLTGGGTGGHLFPAVATAQNLCARIPGSEVLFIGTKRRLDQTHLERYGFAVRTIHSYGLKGKKIISLIKALTVLPFSFLEACYHITLFKPQVVCGVGGYVTGPVVAAAWLLRKPTIIHEQNSIPGLANRKLGRLVDRICLSLPDSHAFFSAEKTEITGNPVRTQILELLLEPKQEHRQKTVVILGGSQGASVLNKRVVEAFTSRETMLQNIRIIHQTGVMDADTVKQAYTDSGIDAQVAPFFNDMTDVYRQADLVISRAGATTLAELAVLGIPSILVPYPYAADNHQEKNAAGFVREGGAILLRQNELTVAQLVSEITALLGDPQRLKTMSNGMRKLGIPDAADRIVDICLEIAH